VVFAWPSTELAVMGAEGAAPIIFRKELEKSRQSGRIIAGKIRQYREEFANPYRPPSTSMSMMSSTRRKPG